MDIYQKLQLDHHGGIMMMNTATVRPPNFNAAQIRPITNLVWCACWWYQLSSILLDLKGL